MLRPSKVQRGIFEDLTVTSVPYLEYVTVCARIIWLGVRITRIGVAVKIHGSQGIIYQVWVCQ